MSDRNTARIRTALPTVWAAIATYVATRLGYVPDDVATELILVVIVPGAGAVVYEVGRSLESSNSTVGRLVARALLGSLKQPSYSIEEPPTLVP